VASDEATAKANAKVTAKYERYLAPLRKYALAFAVGYVLAHGPQILAFSKSLFEVSK
jgi:hypothetical protein